MKIQAMRLPHSELFFYYLAAVHLLLFSICPVSSRIYQTNDAVVIEVDSAVQPATRLATGNYVNPAPIPMLPYAINLYTNSYYYYQQQQSNLLSWLYPMRIKPVSASWSSSVISDVVNGAATSPESRQQKIACGVGPLKPPVRQTSSVRIIGGTTADANSWPFVVGVRSNSPTYEGTVFCGGTLISTTRILTAARCVNKFSTYEISTMSVSLGMNTQGGGTDLVNDAQQTRRVTRAVYHKDYNDKTNLFDIAMLTIDPPVSYTKDISPVCLPAFNNAVDPFVDKNAAIMGWGRFSVDSTLSSNELQQTTVKVISNAECNVPYEDALKPQQFCAKADGIDACGRDVGGPLVVQQSDGSPWVQAGVISLTGCTNQATPSVYANVAFFQNWINTYMNS